MTDLPTFGDRLFAELSAVEDGPDFETFCDGIGSMFEELELISGTSSAGDVGYSIILDINRIPLKWLGYLAQFIGASDNQNLGDDDAARRAWVMEASGMSRGRPASIIAAVKTTLTGPQFVSLRERDGSAWRYTVITHPDDTPSTTKTDQMVQETKPGPDIATLLVEEFADYEWLRTHISDYGALRSAYATYADLADQEMT